MKMPALFLTVIAVALLAAHASPQDKANPSPKERIEESAKKIKELQKERIDTRKALVDHLTILFKIGRAPYEEVLEARVQLLKAELDAVEKESDRIALYKKTADALTLYEQLANANVQAGRGTVAAVLSIKARRLEVEIQLERAKAKEAKEGK